MQTFSSLFTGGGLADIGARQAGYELLWGVEIDTDIAAVARANLKHQVYAASVIGFDWESLAKPDHLHMSPPCQDYSVAKTSGKISNPNDEIADACLEALKALQPKTVTVENVEGYRKAKGFQRIVDYLWGAGYWVNVDVLNSANFGVPQTRRRLILRAVQGGIPVPLPEPVKWRGWYEAIEDLIPGLPETQFAAWQLERLPDELKETLWMRSGNTKQEWGKGYKLHSEPINTVDTGFIGSKAYLVESKNANQQYGDGVRESHQPHTTVITDHKPSHQPKVLLVPGGNASSFSTRDGGEPSRTVESTNRVGNIPRATVAGRVVRMTPRCLARFQSVPDWYVLPEKTALACKIIGNGIPCLMMQAIMESFEQSFEANNAT